MQHKTYVSLVFAVFMTAFLTLSTAAPNSAIAADTCSIEFSAGFPVQIEFVAEDGDSVKISSGTGKSIKPGAYTLKISSNEKKNAGYIAFCMAQVIAKPTLEVPVNAGPKVEILASGKTSVTLREGDTLKIHFDGFHEAWNASKVQFANEEIMVTAVRASIVDSLHELFSALKTGKRGELQGRWTSAPLSVTYDGEKAYKRLARFVIDNCENDKISNGNFRDDGGIEKHGDDSHITVGLPVTPEGTVIPSLLVELKKEGAEVKLAAAIALAVQRMRTKLHPKLRKPVFREHVRYAEMLRDAGWPEKEPDAKTHPDAASLLEFLRKQVSEL